MNKLEIATDITLRVFNDYTSRMREQVPLTGYRTYMQELTLRKHGEQACIEVLGSTEDQQRFSALLRQPQPLDHVRWMADIKVMALALYPDVALKELYDRLQVISYDFTHTAKREEVTTTVEIVFHPDEYNWQVGTTLANHTYSCFKNKKYQEFHEYLDEHRVKYKKEEAGLIRLMF